MDSTNTMEIHLFNNNNKNNAGVMFRDRFRFTDLLVCELPDSFATAALGTEQHPTVDMDKARRQHAAYLDAFRTAGIKTITVLPPAEAFPDCVFVEDTAVVIGDTALIARPGADTRRGETDRIRSALLGLGFSVVDVEGEDAILDGGDVIFTGKEIIVGLSHRTNKAGADFVRQTFPNFPVVQIEVFGPLHLTTRMHLCDPNTFCVSTETPDSMAMFKQIQAQSKVDYTCVEVADDNAANCILLNGHLICKAESEHPESYRALQKALPNHKLIGLEMSEIEKAVGSISCMSLRFKRPEMFWANFGTRGN